MSRLIFTMGFGFILALASGCQPGLTREQQLMLDDGRRAYDAGQYSRAIQRLNVFLEKARGKPETAAALYLIGMSQAQIGQRSEAVRSLRIAAQSGTDVDTAWRAQVVLGTIFWEQEDWAQASEAWLDALPRIPDAAPEKETVLLRLGLSLERCGRWAESRGPFRQLADKYPSSSAADLARRRLLLNPDHFAVQCGVFTNQANAENLAASLRRANLAAFVRTEPRERRMLHVVLVGRYAGLGDARRGLELVQRYVPKATLWP